MMIRIMMMRIRVIMVMMMGEYDKEHAINGCI
jgi:hypothetical protein